jgi:hypothetical protein
VLLKKRSRAVVESKNIERQVQPKFRLAFMIKPIRITPTSTLPESSSH